MADVVAATLLAVLIDGDNFSPDLAVALFSAVSKLGKPTVRRVYGGSSGIAGWRTAAATHGIGLHEAMPGKNATDMRLAIDAIDLHHRGRLDGFCIVSSDGDFAELARRLREDGVTVHGFGGSNAAAGFRKACDSFSALEKCPSPASTVLPPPPAPKASSVQPPASEWTTLLKKALGNLPVGSAQVKLQVLARQVILLDKGFSAKKYQASSLKALLITSGLELKKAGAHWIVVLPADIRRAA